MFTRYSVFSSAMAVMLFCSYALAKGPWPYKCPLPRHPDYKMSLGAHPDERYVVDNKNGTVKDLCTKLIWEQSPSTISMNWEAAKSYCAESRTGKFADWRLPNLDDLKSIVDNTARNPAINGHAFPKTPLIFFWSSSPRADVIYSAWRVAFGSNGYVSYAPATERSRVRCVR